MGDIRSILVALSKMVAIIVIFVLSLLEPSSAEKLCRSKYGSFRQPDFNLHACSWCYFFLYPDRPLKPSFSHHYLTVISNTTGFALGTKLVPDLQNQSNHELICSTLSPDECDRWRLCCMDAVECCKRQLLQQGHNDVTNGTCSGTWDGYGCWETASAGSTNHISCPTFLKFSVPTRSAMKTCQKDGSWLKKGGRDWTDYTPCLNYEELKVSIFISLGCQIASLTCLIPSLIIFFQYHSLRRQHRIRLHINFFISFVMNGICVILWDLLVTYDKLTNPNVTDTNMYQNGSGCKLLSFMKIYFTSTTYAWMFCEGLYLYRLIANAFSPPKRLLLVYIAGWGIPLLFCSTYAVLRTFTADESCWAKSMENKEWIIYAPNLSCLVVNVFFLCNILRILLTQLQAHPNEPSNFRRAFKATFVLIPLFGVQLFVTIHRVPPEQPGAIHYERMSEVVTNTQGMFVALIFCFFNTEVITHVKRTWRHFCWNRLSRTRSSTLILNLNNTVSQRYDGEHMALKKTSKDHIVQSPQNSTTAQAHV